MARPCTITDEQILEAARVLFTERGQEVTTAEIAARAGVSEGTIFKRFQTKDHLFFCAMKTSISRAQWIALLDEPCGREELRARLVTIASQMLDTFMVLVPRLQVILVQDESCRQALLSGEDSSPIIVLKKLTGFFERAQRAGLLRPTCPQIMARMFIGALHHYCFVDRVGLHNHLPMPRELYVRGVVATLLDGASLPQLDESSP